MSEHNWVTSDDPDSMLEMLAGVSGSRKRRLFACACGRTLWPLLGRHPELLEAIELAESYADGLTSFEELGRASDRVIAVRADRPLSQSERRELFISGMCASAACGDPSGFGDHRFVAWFGDRSDLLSCLRLCDLYRDLFPNPFRDVPLSPDVLAWQGGTVVALAQAAYDERHLPAGTLDPAALAVLADALDDAGGADAEFTAHLREPGRHYRGCWVVDLILSHCG